MAGVGGRSEMGTGWEGCRGQVKKFAFCPKPANDFEQRGK